MPARKVRELQIPPQFDLLMQTKEELVSFLAVIDSRFPPRDPFTGQPADINGKIRKSSSYISSEVHHRHFINWCVREKLNLGPAHFSREHFTYYSRYLREDLKYGDPNTSSALSALRVFFDYLIFDKGWQFTNPIPANLFRRSREYQRRAISQDEFKNLIESFDVSQLRKLKLRLIIMFAYDGCARIGEVLNLKLKDLTMPSDSSLLCSYKARRKNSKFRRLFLSPASSMLLRVYLKRAGITKADRPIFPQLVDIRKPLSQTIVGQNIRKILMGFGIRRKMYGTHIMRHSGASHMVSNGADPSVVADYMSHSDLGITLSVYARPEEIEVIEAYRKFFTPFDLKRASELLEQIHVSS